MGKTKKKKKKFEKKNILRSRQMFEDASPSTLYQVYIQYFNNMNI